MSPLDGMTVRPSGNHGARRGGVRPDILLLHYTGMASARAAVDWLCDPESEVSCHYLVDEAGRITRMVDEERRAWHAGAGSWGGTQDINSRSIGVEIHNPGHGGGYPGFPDRQMRAVEALCLDILSRHDAIAPRRVLAHSDIAPGRKADPGEKFDWARLAAAGIGHWIEPDPVGDGGGYIQVGDRGAPVEALQSMLGAYGYGIEISGIFDEATGQVVTAFQRHFRPGRIDGVADASTVATLHRLLRALPAL